MDNKGIWVLLSHSHKDYERVKLVRDKLEQSQFRPLMFFLKCLEEETEINDLIKREIDARTRFILCKSNNADSSDWVQKEIAYIKSKGRMYDTVDLDAPVEKIEEDLKRFKWRSTVFISYSRHDHDFEILPPYFATLL